MQNSVNRIFFLKIDSHTVNSVEQKFSKNRELKVKERKNQILCIRNTIEKRLVVRDKIKICLFLTTGRTIS